MQTRNVYTRIFLDSQAISKYPTESGEKLTSNILSRNLFTNRAERSKHFVSAVNAVPMQMMVRSRSGGNDR